MSTIQRSTYVVFGNGQFPDDMLRYDQATIIGHTTLLHRPAYLIDGYCTEGRWRSFLWACFPARRHLPAGNSEQGPVNWQAKVQSAWVPIDVLPPEVKS